MAKNGRNGRKRSAGAANGPWTALDRIAGKESALELDLNKVGLTVGDWKATLDGKVDLRLSILK